MPDTNEEPISKRVINKEELIIRPATATRPAIRIVITQTETDNQEIAMASAVLINMPIYFEKPNILDDIAAGLHVAAWVIRKLNKLTNAKR